MASVEHLDLSNFIKSVHETLRTESRTLGPKKAWEKHCNDNENLERYSESMRELATRHWEKDNKKDPNSRVKWVCDLANNYYCLGDALKRRQKEVAIAQLENINSLNFTNFKDVTLKMLDVGSCYNPFREFNMFDVIAVDIAPADSTVLKCDFLNVKLTDDNMKFSHLGEVNSLQREHFHIIVFCLLLEYIPTPEQRLSCCQKAYDLLAFEGLLVIITPDSKHVGANAKIIKSWRYILAEMGFSRVKYEKLKHLHCMAFRKSCKKELAQRWAKLHENYKVFDEFVIPQDFNIYEKNIKEPKKEETKCNPDLFSELPNII